MRLFRFLCLIVVSLALNAAEPKPHLRLPDSVTPTRYQVDLTLDPAKSEFSGAITIGLNVKKPARSIWLNANEISVSVAALKLKGSPKPMPAKAIPGGDDFLELQFESEIPMAAAELTIRYTGKVRQRDSSGVFHMSDSGNHYLFTQFEPTDARGAFPCFDEPSYKVPWQLTIHTPASNTVVSNTPIASEKNTAAEKTYVFKETKPIPSYLVAFAVGAFEYVDAGKAGKNGVPVRIVMVKGHAYKAQYAAEVTSTILTRLEDYFGIPYPYEKSDQLAIPTTFGFGAMENPGLVTYAENILLSDPARDTLERQRECASVEAHELAHQWFGDLVTTAWWNDIWLNEAFATWMEQKLIAEWKPEWTTRVNDVRMKQFAEREDSIASARKIRQEIQTKDDITNAFDGITYQKGAAVIAMFESYVGPDEFRKGVQSYLKQYAFRTTTAPEFLDAIGTASKKDVTKPFATFLNQAGVPVVSASLDCTKSEPTLHLEQRRSLSMGAQNSGAQNWQLPVCARFGFAGGGSERSCVLLTEVKQDWRLPSKTCPSWVQMNDKAVGYYQVDYSDDLRQRLLSSDSLAAMTAPERLDLLFDERSATAADRSPVADSLNLVRVFRGDSDRQVTMAALDLAMQPDKFVPSDLVQNYQRYLQKNFGERARQIGWSPKPGEPEDISLLRPQLLQEMATIGGDQELAAQAKDLAETWLKNHSSLDANLVRSVLQTTGYYGDKDLATRFLAAWRATEDKQVREDLAGAMNRFRDAAAIKEIMNAVMAGQIPFMEGGGMLIVATGQSAEATRKIPFEFVKAHYDDILSKSPRGGFDFGSFLPMVGRSFCEPSQKEDLNTFFAPRVGKVSGAGRMLAQTLEGIDVCIASRNAQLPSLRAFLEKF